MHVYLGKVHEEVDNVTISFMLAFTVLFQYAGINIGPVHKKDIMKASIMLEHDPQ